MKKLSHKEKVFKEVKSIEKKIKRLHPNISAEVISMLYVRLAQTLFLVVGKEALDKLATMSINTIDDELKARANELKKNISGSSH